MKNQLPETRKSKSLDLSSNALYYAVASFFLFGALLGIMAIIESQKALQIAQSEHERKKAKKVLLISIIGISPPAIGFILGLFDHGTSFGGALLTSWLVTIIVIMSKLVS